MCGAELTSLPEGVQRVAAVLQSHEHPHAPVMLAEAARTAQQAADALGVALVSPMVWLYCTWPWNCQSRGSSRLRAGMGRSKPRWSVMTWRRMR